MQDHVVLLLRDLSPRRQALFGLTCFDRLRPGFDAWLEHRACQMTGHALYAFEPPVLQWIQGGEHDNGPLVEVLSVLEKESEIVYSDEMKGDPFSRLASGTLGTIQILLEFCLGRDPTGAEKCAKIAIDTIWEYVYYATYPYVRFGSPEDYRSFRAWLDDCPMLILERQRQEEIVNQLSGTDLDVEWIRARASENLLGIDLIQRGFVRPNVSLGGPLSAA